MSDENGQARQLHAGQRFYCQHCKSDSVVQVLRDIQGFRILSEKAVCAFCKTEIADAVLVKPRERTDDTTEEKPAAGASALSSLLQLDSDDSPEKTSLSDLLADTSASTADASRAFCRDCYYYLHHPFLSRCSLHERTVEPMDDCPSFRAKTKKRHGTGDG